MCFLHILFKSILTTQSIVGVITRAIAIATDALVLAVTLYATWDLFKTNSTVRAQSPLLLTFVQNGKLSERILGHITQHVCRFCSVFVSLIFLHMSMTNA